ncbi:dienelactone hydrolase [Rhizobium sp. ERR 922]|uniref:dienelactone hydrolase family protein n=1 Tax=unclassified Rhizobium TaxID=2613769 RepID=UPI0011A6C017|nr:MULTISPECIES: dienelactone hydrolase family protein [unclassified Rhizobium]TWB50437.1 dienelactone hydrolase [Rhizobium sp. ERR 922]TWB92817.1 dienelactone hydrolase [Rhizobium sp. ERR 942]
MATVIFFHSVYGLRSLEHEAVERVQAAGHKAFAPDLYDGLIARSIEEGSEFKDEIGWATICERAEWALAGLPASTVLAGFSMGAAVAASLWPKREKTAGILFLHGIASIAENARKGLPLQLHLADPDPFEPEEDVATWRQGVTKSGVAAEIFRYPGGGHLYTDASLPDYNAQAADLTWKRVIDFLDAIDVNA